jgi:hypothetical protein
MPEAKTSTLVLLPGRRFPTSEPEAAKCDSEDFPALDESHHDQNQRDNEQDVNQPAQEMQAEADNPEHEQNSDYPPHLVFSALIVAAKLEDGKRVDAAIDS